MPRRFLLLTLCLVVCVASLCRAQTTAVTLQATDTDPQTWNNGSWTAALYSPPGVPQGPYVIAGGSTPVPNQQQNGVFNASGAGSLTVTPNTSISPSGTQWSFVFCPLATPSACQQVTASITGITQTLAPALPAIRLSVNNPTVRVTAYTDTEIIGANLGSTYFNLIDQTLHVCIAFTAPNCTLWSVVGSGGSGANITAGPGILITPSLSSQQISLLPALPNGETATTQPTCDTSNAVATDAAIVACLSSNNLLPQTGCGVEWTGGLNFTVGACINYTINGNQYSSPLTNVTLATADPSHPRLDVIDVNSSSNVFQITGVPAVTPAVPTVDPSTQLVPALDTILVPTGSSTPAVTKSDIYHENVQGPTEWNTSFVGSFNLASTNNPYDGTVDIEATSAATGSYVQMVCPSACTVQMQNYNSHIFYLRSKATWDSTRALAVQWFNGSTPLGTPVLVRPTGTFGFNSSITTAYQQISIATSTFGINGVVANTIRFTVVGTGGNVGFYLDDITLQGGQNGNLNSNFLSLAGTWNNTTGYNPNQVVFFGGASWIDLVANVNSTPAISNANWFAMFNCGTNQQVMFNDNGLCAGNNGMLFDKVTGNFTITGQSSAASFSATAAGAFTLSGVEGTAPSGVAGKDILWADSTNHCWRMNNNNGGSTPCLSTGATIASATTKQIAVYTGATALGGIDFPDTKIIPAANCNNATAGNGWSIPASNAPTAACRAGTNNLGGALQWANNNTTMNAQFTFELPADWDTSAQPYINIIYGSGANTSGTVKWTFSSACTKSDGSVTDDPTFNAESATTGKTMAVANRMWAESIQFTAVTSGNNCIAGSTVIVKVTSGNGTAASTVNVYQATVTTPRLLTVQAN